MSQKPPNIIRFDKISFPHLVEIRHKARCPAVVFRPQPQPLGGSFEFWLEYAFVKASAAPMVPALRSRYY